MVEIQLPVLDASGQRRIEEAVPAEPLSPGRYRLLASPGLVEGVAAGDELELAPAEPAGFRVLRRGGQLCVWVYLPEPPPPDAEGRLRRAAAVLGGYLDGGQIKLRVLTVPVTAGFPSVEAELNATVADLDGSTWAYGNVYDPRDADRPLGWWEGSALVDQRLVAKRSLRHEVDMIAFEISIDGQKKCAAGLSDLGVASVIANWIRRASRDPTSGQPIPGRFSRGSNNPCSLVSRLRLPSSRLRKRILPAPASEKIRAGRSAGNASTTSGSSANKAMRDARAA